MGEIDERFLALPLDALCAAALERVDAGGASYAEVRIEQIHHQSLSLRDAKLEGATDDRELGLGIRVALDGSLGFAATVALDAASAVACAEQALEAARTIASARSGRVELADEPAYGRVVWVAPYRIDPTSVPLAERVERLATWSAALLEDARVEHVSASLDTVAEQKHFANLAGTITTQQRVRLQPVVEAIAFDEEGRLETMRTCAPPAGRGYEYLDGDGWDFAGELAQLPELLAEKLAAPSVRAGTYDLVIDPTNLWLTIHESVGHATELDRALGYEAAYAGTSFATFDQLGSLRYGGELMHVTGDRTTPYGLATVGYDDEGVKAQSFDLVRDGILVGYQLDRRIASEAGLGRSNGCGFAASPLLVPMQRMANVSLAPADGEGPTLDDLIGQVEDGIYVVGDKSWSIDMQRYNFQFTGQRFYAIKNGRLAGQLRDVAYQATTTEFWGSLANLGGRSTYLLAGAFNCGKGQPGQTAPVGHGSPAAHFSSIRVLNAKAESGR